tara:strand:- start:125 stop:874 length:750 start_codon:yes stop_codon:yes gene_type:complete
MEDLNDILKLSGMKAKVNEAEVEEAYANEPDEEYQTVDAIIRQGNDLNREKQQHPKGGFTGDNPLAEAEVDEDEVRELVLFIDSDGQLYQQQGEPIMRNLSRKWDKGIYDHELAQKLWYYLAVNGAKKYGQEHGTGNGLKMFSPAVRRAAAKEMADNWMEELKAGNKMDEAEEDLEAMLAEILIGEESPEERVMKTMPSYKLAQTLGKGVKAGKEMFDKSVDTVKQAFTPPPAKKPTQPMSVMPESKEE